MSVLSNLEKIVMNFVKGKIEALLPNYNTSPFQHALSVTLHSHPHTLIT